MTSPAADPPPPPPAPPRPGRLRVAARVAERLLAVAGLFFIVYHGGFDVSRMVEGSMSPTLQGDFDRGDWVLAEKISGWFRSPRRWDVVMFQNKEGLQVMKRVVGLPGETVAIRDGKVVINGNEIAPPPSLSFLNYYPFGDLAGGKSVPCGTGYFVLGDDSKDSEDSRYEGPLEPGRIKARPWLRVWPWKRIGRVNP